MSIDVTSGTPDLYQVRSDLYIFSTANNATNFIWVNSQNAEWFGPITEANTTGALQFTGWQLTGQFAPVWETDPNIIHHHEELMRTDPEYRRQQEEALARLREEQEGYPFDNFWKLVDSQIIEERACSTMKELLGENTFRAVWQYDLLYIKSALVKNLWYRVRKDAKIELYEGKKYLGWLCIHAVSEKLPIPDAILAKMLMLQCDEAKFLKTANLQNMQDSEIIKEVEAIKVRV